MLTDACWRRSADSGVATIPGPDHGNGHVRPRNTTNGYVFNFQGASNVTITDLT